MIKNFKPKFSFYEIEYLIGDGFGKKIKNESVHAIVFKHIEWEELKIVRCK